MSVSTEQIEDLIHRLSPHAQAEVLDFVEFLLSRQERQTKYALRQDWAGALREHRDQYTSLDLQQKALDWRGD